MITYRATVTGPWGPVGSEFHVKEPTKVQRRYIGKGYLVEVDTYAGMTAKQRAQARAEALGLDTSGSQKEIEARIEEAEANGPDEGDGS